MPRDKTGHFYYSWFPTIIAADTQHLTLAQDGAYRRLIDHYMVTRSSLPDNDIALARIVGIGVDEWLSIQAFVKPYFKPDPRKNGYLVHSFCQELLNSDSERIAKAKVNGAKGGRKKSLNNKGKNRGVEKTEPSTLAKQNKTEQNIIVVDDVNACAGKDFSKVFDFGINLFPDLAPKNTSSIKKWINAGCDVAADILPSLESCKGRNIASWNYFDRIIMDAKATREKPLPEGIPNENTINRHAGNTKQSKSERFKQSLVEGTLADIEGVTRSEENSS